MSESSRKIFMTPKRSKITQITSVTPHISSEIPMKNSLLNRACQSWLTIVVSLVAVAAILGIVSLAVGVFAFSHSTTPSTSTITSMSSSTTTTGTMCYTLPSPRPSNVWLLVDNMTYGRVSHSATPISQDNSILITGGYSGLAYLSSVEKYIPSTGCFQSMRDMPRTRYMHTADQLPSLSGYVLIAGGYNPTAGAIGFADLYHPMTGDIVTISLTSPRYPHTSTIISSSQLVLIGGYTTGAIIANSSDMINTATSSSFQPGTNIMSEPHLYHAATLLGNNSNIILVAGELYITYISSAYLYHGISNSFVALGSGVSMLPARDSVTATYLPSPINKVLLTGGYNSAVFGTMVLFDVASLAFTTLTSTLVYARYLHTATLLPNGKILLVGGYNGGSLRTCELIDPSNNYSATRAANLTTNRYYHTTSLIPDSNNGTVLVCGGYNSVGAIVNTCELYFV